MDILRTWWQAFRSPILFGLAFGWLWGLLTAGTVTYPEWLAYDQKAGIVYKYSDFASAPQITPADTFFNEYKIILVQATLILLILSGLAGWSTWQLGRVRPRGEDQPPLLVGSDWYVMALAMGGLWAVYLFRYYGWEIWFKGSEVTLPVLLKYVLGLLLPLYAGVALFMVWFRRLKSVRAPDWETHYPKRTRKKTAGALKQRLFRQKRGDHDKLSERH